MYEFIIEGVKKIASNAEALKSTIETQKLELLDNNGFDFTEFPVEAELDYMQEQTVATDPHLEAMNDRAQYMSDDIGLCDITKDFGNSDYINEIRAQNMKVDIVMSRQEGILSNNPSDLEYQRAAETLNRYKGTVLEYELKDTLANKFESVDVEQQLVPTDWGATKPDVILRGAVEDMRISDLQIAQGEDLYIEAKCGSSSYIRNEMGHILKQVEGHGENSLIVVTRDYMELSPDVRGSFEKQLAEKGSHLYVADVTSTEMNVGIISSLKL
ncbi:hypothetical protein [Paenibacillus agricola]|uniref:Uncharacterized protein n=1 Tax=Paenibacillus agricola TaxID=2716264 RepID=A0ABX0JF63_9BACL|nr:hypothetical protein [Paenibacillus agricola]NHN34401.1 hypothetical protein [Paenibacillus agricola]